jgi:outer membrane protein OmpA-like peptidoglycan-associated protein
MLKSFLLPLYACLSLSCFSQESEFHAEGKVTDSRSGRGIKASIRYSSIPTGSITGRFSDSTFSFALFGTAKYQISVEAPGYNPKTIIVTPKDIDASTNKVIRNISLSAKGETIVLDHLIFEKGKSHIDRESFSELDEIVQMLKENPKVNIQLEGHTDNQGSPKANQALSEKRVLAVKKYISDKGIQKSRIKTKAFGGSQPLRNEMTQEARALNRRVEMRILND